MGDGMVGADADMLSVTGRQFVRSSAALIGHRDQLASMFASASWTGADAEHSRADWNAVGSPALARTSRFVESLGNRLLEHAAEQQGASAIGQAGARMPGAIGFGPWRHGDLLDDFRELVDEVLDGWFANEPASPSPAPDAPASGVSGLRPSEFEAPAEGRDAVLMAMQGLAEEDRIARDEIEIRALDNGRYIVVLPGVTDLSEGFDQFVDQVREDGPVRRAGGRS